MPDQFYNSHIILNKASATETDDGRWIISGAVASLDEDYDGEVLEKSGVLNGLKTFWKMGRHIDIDHKYQQTQDWNDIVGKAVEIVDVKGVPHLVAELNKENPQAAKVWRHLKGNMEAGFSIFGKALKRDPKNPKRVLDTEIHMITIALSPKGFDARAKVGRPDVFTPLMMAKAIVQKAGMPMEQALPPSPDPMAEQMPPQGAPVDPMAGQMPPQGAPEPAPAEGEEPPPPSKQEVNYRPGSGDEACANCALFSSGQCLLLQDQVRPMDTCDAFQPMDDEEAQGGAPTDAAPTLPQGAPPPNPMMGKAMEVATKAHSDCPSCGTKMYCLKCHRDGHGSVQKAKNPAVPTDACPRCGGQLTAEEQLAGRCDKCDAATKSDEEEDVVDKAYTTGEGVVMPGETSSAALRTQYLRGKGQLRKRKPGAAVKNRTEDEGGETTAKSLLIRQITEKVGSAHAERLADEIITKARAAWAVRGGNKREY